MTTTTSSSKIKRLLTSALISLAVSGCASKLPTPQAEPDIKANRETATKKFEADQVAVERVKVPKSSMKPVVEHTPIPDGLAKTKISINFQNSPKATLEALVLSLSSENVQVAFKWSDPTQSENILNRKLPFLTFEGTVGELMETLRTGMGIVSFYENGVIYISDKQRYSVTVPQNDKIIEAISKELKDLGADNIVSSLRGGKVMYMASPMIQDDLIKPYLDRMSRNLSVINLQVAVVSLSLTDKSGQGFNWDAFKMAFDSTQTMMKSVTGDGTVPNTSGSSSSSGSSTGTSTGTGTGTGTGTTSTTTNGLTPSTVGTVISATSSALTFGKTSTGSLFGTYGALNISSAIDFLSTFGKTNVTQNVQLKTLSGTEVAFQSGQEVPYVTGVSNTQSSNNNNVMGSSNTSKVETGLKLKLKPLFDGDAQLVTIDVSMELNSILQYIKLDAGNQIGSFTQPEVQKQNLTNLVQAQVGQTVVIGGLQYENDDFKGSDPTVLRDKLEAMGRTFGSRTRDTSRSALFIILRPAVTIYEADQ